MCDELFSPFPLSILTIFDKFTSNALHHTRTQQTTLCLLVLCSLDGKTPCDCLRRTNTVWQRVKDWKGKEMKEKLPREVASEKKGGGGRKSESETHCQLICMDSQCINE